MTVLQKYRSNAMDPRTGLGLSEEFLAETYPWVFGEKCPLEYIAKVLARYEKTHELEPQTYYNFMTIMDKFTPEIRVAAVMLGGELPEGPPSIQLLIGWDK